MGRDERHYNINKLSFLFAMASIVLLSAIVLLFFKDYSREWKDYQEQFRALEVEHARVKYDLVNNELKGKDAYKRIVSEFEEAQKEYEANCSDFTELEAEIETLKAENAIVNQNYKFRKADLDAAKYRYEASKAHHSHGGKEVKAEFESLDQSTHELKLALEESDHKLQSKLDIIKECGVKLNNIARQKRRISSKKDLLERKLDKIDPNEMGFVNQIAGMVRNLPVLDLANPTNKIEQVVLKDVRDDVNFMTVPKVERCLTCHLGIANPDYTEAVQPFKTHPKLDLMVDKNSPHPIEEFGCTVCHGGRSRGTSFAGAAHTPNSPLQKKQWEEKYGWHKVELWEEPMLPVKYTEAGCFKCHSGESIIKGAEKLDLGLHVIEKAGCYNCHVIDKYKDWPKSGPDLTKIAAKLPKDWAYKWIEDPQSFRHNTWMPAFFNQSNNNDPESLARGQQEIHAMVHFLYAKSKNFDLTPVPVQGDFKRGEELVSSVGCLACHQVKPESSDDPITKKMFHREFGPNLIGLGSKTSKEWLYSWLKDPNRYHPGTRMPSLRLDDQEAADITSYLIVHKNREFDRKNIPSVNEPVIDRITFDFLVKSHTNKQAESKLSDMSLDDKLYFAGEKLIGRYGCFACHNIDGFADRKPIGAELTEEGRKSLHKLDFGFIHIDHTKQAWFAQKLKDPRIFDQGKVKQPDEKLIMPNFYLSQDEIEAAVTALLGFVGTKGVEGKVKPRTTENLYIEEGQKIVRQMNCQGCHVIEGDGGTIQDNVKEWLMKYDKRTESEADTVYESFSPPNLHGIGAKLDPKWLFEFIHQPSQEIRPWLRTRMPTYNFNDAHLNTLVRYFNSLDANQDLLYKEEDVSLTQEQFQQAEKLFSEDYLGCTQCHVVGDQWPGGSQDSWAPNLAWAKTRLNREWMIEWIKSPSTLMPGTKMPTFFDPDDYDNSGPSDLFDGDEDMQIRMLRNYLLMLTDTQSVPPATPPQETTPQN